MTDLKIECVILFMENRKIPLLWNTLKEDGIRKPDAVLKNFMDMGMIDSFRSPSFCLISFFRDLNEYVKDKFNAKEFKYRENSYVLLFDYKGKNILYIPSEYGAPNAGKTLEEMIALGAEKIIFLGSVGVITDSIKRGEIIVPDKAIRDEGTSFHYEEASVFSYPDHELLKIITGFLEQSAIKFRVGGTWTTDAIYRETPGKLKKIKHMGVLSVDMEASALFSVAKYRKKKIAGMFISGDSISTLKWVHRKEKDYIERTLEQKKKLLEYAIEIISLL